MSFIARLIRAFQERLGRGLRVYGRPKRQNRNAVSALGQAEAQAVVYGVWASGIAIGGVIFVLLVVLIGDGVDVQSKGARNIQTAVENLGPEVAPVQFIADGKIALVEKWAADMNSTDPKVKDEATKAYKGALARGQANYGRICLGCHFGPPEETSNGPWLGNLYQTGALYNGKPMNDQNVVTFILLGSQSHNLNADGTKVLLTTKNQDPNGLPVPKAGAWNPMPAGIATPQQAVDIMLYLKQQTCPKVNPQAVRACS